MMKKTVSVLGCGWLGLPLATHLTQNGWQVKGSTTSDSKLKLLKEKEIDPYLIDLTKEADLPKDFFDSDYQVLNIPPSKLMRKTESYQPLIECLSEVISSKVVFISSTSVYKENNGIVNEDNTDAIIKSENTLLDIERMFQKAIPEITILRFGGLVGGVRYPSRFFTPDTRLDGYNQPVNLIHLDDCIQIIDRILTKDIFGEVFNGVADTHPDRKTFYTKAARLKGQEPPSFSDRSLSYKIVSNQKVKDVLGIKFMHPDLLSMLEDVDLWS